MSVLTISLCVGQYLLQFVITYDVNIHAILQMLYQNISDRSELVVG